MTKNLRLGKSHASQLTTNLITSITSVPAYGTVVPCCSCKAIDIVPIGLMNSSPERNERTDVGRSRMRLMHLCYAAIGFAVARWIFKRQALPIADPVSRFRSQGLL